MNKQAYEHMVGLVLSKEAGFWDNVGGAFKDTWGDIKNSWNASSDDTKRNVISAGATGLLGTILGGAFGGWRGALLGGLGAGLAGWAGSKHVYPWMNKWYDHYQTHKETNDAFERRIKDSDGTVDREDMEPETVENQSETYDWMPPMQNKG